MHSTSTITRFTLFFSLFLLCTVASGTAKYSAEEELVDHLNTIVQQKKQHLETSEKTTATEHVRYCRFLVRLSYMEIQVNENLSTFIDTCREDLQENFADHPKAILFFLEQNYENFDEEFNRIVSTGVHSWSEEDLQTLYYTGATKLEDEQRATAYALLVNPEQNTYWVYSKVVEHFKEKYPEDIPKHCLDTLRGLAKTDYEKETYFNDYYADDSEIAEYFMTELENEDSQLNPLIEVKLYALNNNLANIKEIIESNEEHYEHEAMLELLVKNPPSALDLADRVDYYKQWTGKNWTADLLLTEWFALAKRSDYRVVLPPVLNLLITSALLIGTFLCPLLIIIPIHYFGLIREKHYALTKPIYPNITLLSLIIVFGGLLLGEVFISQFFNNTDLLTSVFDPYYFEQEETLTAQNMLYTTVFSFLLALLVVNKKLIGMLHPPGRPATLRILGVTGLCVLLCIAASAIIQFSGLLSNTFIIDGIIQNFIKEYGLWITWLVIAFLGPIFEELLCRSIILNSTQRHLGFWLANSLQAVIFMFLHIDSNLYLYYFLFGFIAGLLYRYAKTLYAPILMHIAINTVAVLALSTTVPEQVDTTDQLADDKPLTSCLNLDDSAPYNGFLDCHLASEQGHSEATNRMVSFLFSNHFPGNHSTFALNALKQTGENADGFTHYLMSQIYLKTKQHRDQSLGVEHLRLSAAGGFPTAQADYAGALLFSGEIPSTEDIEYSIKILEEAIENNHKPARNQLAWFYATTSNDTYRDGEKAVELMTHILPTSEMPYSWIDTLAASYAAIGDFEKAISTQEDAIEIAKESGLSEENLTGLHSRLEKFSSDEALYNDKY